MGSTILLYISKPYLQRVLKTDLGQFDVKVHYTANVRLYHYISRVFGTVFRKETFELWYWSTILGICGFFALTLQQLSLVYITATKAAFITSLYVIATPIFEHFFFDRDHVLPLRTWVAAALSVIGTYLLTGCAQTNNIWTAFGVGDLMVFASMILLTAELIFADIAAKSCDAISLTVVEFLVIAVLAVLVAVIYEPQYWFSYPPLKGLDFHGGWDMIALVSFTEGL